VWVGKNCLVKLNIVSTNYQVYPLVSNNVGIDFTELGPPHGNELGQAAPSIKAQGSSNEKQDSLITIGFRVKPREKAIVQDYVDRMYNQFIVDPSTNEPKRMLDYPISELVTKPVTFSYNSF
jgi:hypothetical protein